jgi:hypothetical protein
MKTQAAVNAMKEQVLADISVVRAGLLADRTLNHQEDEAMTSIETFVAIAIHVFNTTNPSKIKNAMQVVEIRARSDGKKVYDYD